MRYLIQVSSEESKDFELLLQIDAEATFLQLHNLVVNSCKYDASQMASFFTVNEAGARLQEISLMELSSEESELNEAVMDVSTLGEFIGERIRKIEYQYDFFGDRYFILEIMEVQEGSQEEPFLLKQQGVPPSQISLEGFEGIDFAPKAESEELDYEKYLSSFDDCNEGNTNYESLEDFEDDSFE